MLAEDSRFRNNLFPDLTGEHDQAWYRQSLLSSVNYGRGLTAAAATTYYEAFASAAGLGAELVVAANDAVQNGVGPGQALGMVFFGGSGTLLKNADALGDAAYRVGRHGDMPSPRPPGTQSHHGVMSAWMRQRHPSYNADKAPAVLMSTEAHRRTFKPYLAWRAEKTREMGGQFDWKKVKKRDMRALSKQMFDAAGVPRPVQAEYWKGWRDMNATLRKGD